MPGRPVVHIEIPTKDPKASGDFYKQMFAWDIQTMAEPAPYTMFHAENTGGGFTEVGEQTKVGDVLVYILSDNLEADLKKIESLGGKTVMPKMVVGGFGEMAVFTDPTGNRVALWKPYSPG